MLTLPLLLVIALQPTPLPAPAPGEPMQMTTRPTTVRSGYLTPETVTALQLTTLLPTPPSPDSEANKLELTAVLALQQALTPDRRATILAEDKFWDAFRLAPALNLPTFTPQNCPRTAALFRKLGIDISRAQNIPRLHFNRPRPFAADARVQALAQMDPKEPGYPSGHAIRATLLAGLLAEAFPESRQSLADATHLTLLGRAQLGLHYPSDLQAGATVALALHKALKQDPQFQQDWQAAQAELQALPR